MGSRKRSRVLVDRVVAFEQVRRFRYVVDPEDPLSVVEPDDRWGPHLMHLHEVAEYPLYPLFGGLQVVSVGHLPSRGAGVAR